MRLSIYTKYLPATNSHGSRIKASTGEDYPGHTATVGYDHGLSGADVHWQAAKKVADKLNWRGEYVAGTTGDGYVFTPVENPRFFAGDRLAAVKCEPFEYSALFQIMDAHPRQWVPTTENMYYDMLGALPPVAYGNAENWTGFLMGEPVTQDTHGDAIYGAYICVDGKFYAQNMTVKDFKDLPENLELY